MATVEMPHYVEAYGSFQDRASPIDSQNEQAADLLHNLFSRHLRRYRLFRRDALCESNPPNTHPDLSAFTETLGKILGLVDSRRNQLLE